MKSIINNTAQSDNTHCGSLIKCKDMERSNESIYPNILRSKVFNRVSPYPHIFPFISAIKHRLQSRDLLSLEKVSNNELYQYFILFRQSVIGNGLFELLQHIFHPPFCIKVWGTLLEWARKRSDNTLHTFKDVSNVHQSQRQESYDIPSWCPPMQLRRYWRCLRLSNH